jgi:hypothetical protein
MSRTRRVFGARGTDDNMTIEIAFYGLNKTTKEERKRGAEKGVKSPARKQKNTVHTVLSNMVQLCTY